MVPHMVTRYGSQYGNHYGNQNCKQIVIKVGALKVLGPPRTVSRYGTSGGPAISCRPRHMIGDLDGYVNPTALFGAPEEGKRLGMRRPA